MADTVKRRRRVHRKRAALSLDLDVLLSFIMKGTLNSYLIRDSLGSTAYLDIEDSTF